MLVSYYGQMQTDGRTVDRVVANGLLYFLHDALPANIFSLPSVRDNETTLVVVFIVFPAADSSADSNVLCEVPFTGVHKERIVEKLTIFELLGASRPS